MPDLTQEITNPTAANLTSSAELGKLFEALSKAQAVMTPAYLDKKNPHFNSRYASLKSIHDAYQKPLTSNGLSILQQVYSTEGKYFIRTLLCHVTGQWIANVFELILDKRGMQALGSAVSYARRYAISALIGVVDTDDDDDAEAATDAVKSHERGHAAAPRTIAGQAGPSLDAKPAPIAEAPSAPDIRTPGGCTAKQLARMFAIAEARQWSDNDLRHFMYAKYHTDSSKKLTPKQYTELVNTIETMGAGEAIAKVIAEADAKHPRYEQTEGQT